MHFEHFSPQVPEESLPFHIYPIWSALSKTKTQFNVKTLKLKRKEQQTQNKTE